jgi:molecular chaperone GrpE
LLQLVEAFTALRHELKLQTKSTRGLEETVQTTLAGLERAAAQFQSVTAREDQAAAQAAKPLVEALIDLDEALRRGATAIELIDRRIAEQAPQQMQAALDERFAQLSTWRRWLSRRWQAEVRDVCQQQAAELHGRMFAALMDGYQLICARLQRTLAEREIRRMECLGRHVDPGQMTVVELIDDAAAEPETVVAELRPGYTWRNKVIRFAEVRAVRRERLPDAPFPESAMADESSVGDGPSITDDAPFPVDALEPNSFTHRE